MKMIVVPTPHDPANFTNPIYAQDNKLIHFKLPQVKQQSVAVTKNTGKGGKRNNDEDNKIKL